MNGKVGAQGTVNILLYLNSCKVMELSITTNVLTTILILV